MTREQIRAAVMKFDPKECEELAEDIWQRSAPDPTPEQMAELHRRIAAVDRGEMETISGEEGMSDTLERLRRRPWFSQWLKPVQPCRRLGTTAGGPWRRGRCTS